MLKNKVSVITGAARGIGKATMNALAEQGAIVYAVDMREELLLESCREAALKYSAKIIPVPFDITDTDKQRELFLKVWKEQKRLDILLNIAGLAISALIEMSSKSDIERLFATNSVAMIEMIQYASKLMKKNPVSESTRGVIINMSSIAGTHGNRGQIVYSGTKAAVVGITTSAAKELAPYLIRVNAIAPGLIQTPMLEETIDEKIVKEYIEHNVGMHRVGQPEDIVNAIMFLVSDNSNYITGQVIGVDGCFIL